MVDIDTAIERLEKALGTLREAKGLLNGQANGATPHKSAQAAGGSKRLDASQKAWIKSLGRKGKSIAEITRAVGCSAPTVRYHLGK